MKISSFCSGIGSFEQAIKNLGIEHENVFGCEIDKYARQTYFANHECNTMYHDMTKYDYEGEEWYSDINVSGIPCFKAGTLITTSKGLKNIENIKSGDFVLTHKNRFRKVVIPMIKHSKSILDIKIQGSPLISATEEHPFYVREMTRKWNNDRRCDERVFSEPKWVDAKDLSPKTHFVGFGLNTENANIHNLTEEECWFLGRYMADGYITSRGKRNKTTERNLYKVSICVGYKKAEHFPSFNTIKSTPTKERTVTKFHSYNKRLHTLCSFIGKGAENKEIPTFVLNLPIHLLKIFVEGYLSGDGSVKDGKYSATTVSKKLAYSLCQAVFKCYRTPCSITFTKRSPTCLIEGRTVNQRDTYRVQFCKEIRKQNNGICIDGVVWHPIKSIQEREHNDYVYNFEVEEDNSYVAENCIVHNCQAFSLAGKRLGELDPRGLLFFDFYRYVKNQKPKYFIIENVKGLLSDNDGNTFQNWINLLGQSVNGDAFMFPHEDSLMYNLHWQVLNTKDYGLPQNRERVFLIGIRNDLPNSFVFPKGVPLKLRLKDILEDEVDEKYYLSEKIINGFINKSGKFDREFEPKEEDSIANCVTARYAKMAITDNYLKVENIGNTNPSGNGMNGNVFSENGISPTLTTNKGEGIRVQIQSATKSGYEIATEGDARIINPLKGNTEFGWHFEQSVYDEEGVTRALKAGGGSGNIPKVISEIKIGAMRVRNPENTSDRTTGAPTQQMLEINENGTSNFLTSVQKDNLVIQINPSTESGGVQPYQQNRIYDSEGIAPALCRGKSDLNVTEIIQLNNPTHSNDRIYSDEGISPTLNTMQGGNRQPFIQNHYRIRKLTPLECFRLQGFSDKFHQNAVDAGVSNSQLYKQAGNTISVTVIQAILKNLLTV